jgi:hypothetical protein
MKITKSELKEMIREALREELARTKSTLKEYLEERLYEKKVWLPTPKGKRVLSIGVIKDERDYGDLYDDESYEIAVTVLLEDGEEIVLANEELAGVIRSGHTYLRAMDKEDAYEAADALYDYFMDVEDEDVVGTLIALCDEYDANIVRKVFGM